MAKVRLSIKQWNKVVKTLDNLLHLLHDALEERDSFRKQRDELINDMAEIKKKAEAFDEMVKIYNQKNDLPSDEIYMEMGYCISDLERGSDERSRN